MSILKTEEGIEVLIDYDRTNWVSRYNWKCNKDGFIYASSNYYSSSKCKPILLHHFVNGCNSSKLDVEHINGNKLDNRRENLNIIGK